MKKKNLIFILSLFFLASCSTGGNSGSISKQSVSNNSTNNSPSTSNSTSIGYGTSDIAQKPTASANAKVSTPSIGRLSVGYYLNVVDSSSNIVASMKITMSNLSYCVLSYGSNYGTLSTSSSSTTSLELVKGLYYIA